MDAITLLKNDHKETKALFRAFEQAGDSAYKRKREIVDKIIRELAVHSAIEEQVFYPAVRKEVSSEEDMVLEGLEEHHIVKWVLSELDGLDPKDERFEPKVTVLIENVRHHIEEEEGDLFPKVREAMGRKRLVELGSALEAAKKIAPTHPHPRMPDTPPGNVLVGLEAAVMDRAKDSAKAGARSVLKRASARKRSS
ncbi:MAG: hemerythrin domain-containing protein [Frankia sp.]|nr:hemerythrin domain-containing protein [Frankia sp.]